MDTQEEAKDAQEEITPVPPPEEARKSTYTVPASIIIAGALIALAVLYDGKSSNIKPNSGAAAVNDAITGVMKPVNSDDHILGNPDAAIKVVEYSDTECPFCKRFHITMKQIMEEYGSDNRVAWVYRHLPLDSIHPKARKEAEATECAAKLGGNEKFWEYVDRIFEVTPSNNGLDPDELPNIAEYVGLDRKAFESCLASGEFSQKVADSIREATNAGARGTPYSIVVTKDGKKSLINGAEPYEAVKATLDEALAAK